MEIKLKAFKTALPHTIPICAGFICLGISFGFLMISKGFSFIYPIIMSLFIFAGSMQFVAINLLLSAFNPAYAFLLTLMVNARHLFYGISMLDRLNNTGKKKVFLIFWMTDESFSINYTAKIPADVDQGWFMFFVSMLNYIYWFIGSTLGALLGSMINFNIKGIEFVMTAVFVVIFLNQWSEVKSHMSAMIGIGSSVICLLFFGSDQFMLPSMALIVVCFTFTKKLLKREGKVECL